MQRVGEADVQAAALLGDDDEAEPLQPFERPQVGHLLEQGDTDRLAEGDEAERPALVVVEVAQPALHHVDEARRHGGARAQRPHAVGLHEVAGIERADHELVEVEGVAVGLAPQHGVGGRIDRTAEDLAEQRRDVLAGQRADVDPLGELVLPQRGDRVGHRFAEAHGEGDERREVGRQLVHEQRRGVVELVGVVDGQQQRTTAGRLAQHGVGAGQRLGPAACGVGREQRGERTERDVGCRRRRPGVDHLEAEAAPTIHAIDEQTGLAHAGGADDHDPRPVGAPHRAGHPRHLRLPSDEGPGSGHAAQSSRRHATSSWSGARR